MPNYAERITEEANALAGAVRLANATTGAEDTGIVDAVATLIAGYGGGGETPETITMTSSYTNGYDFWGFLLSLKTPNDYAIVATLQQTFSSLHNNAVVNMFAADPSASAWIRFRNGSLQRPADITTTFDADVRIGQVYEIRRIR